MSTIPVTVVCGFLGAGKSTLLNRLLCEPEGERLGVIINDFGTINIDKDLIKVETSDQIELSNGCVCCSVRDDLASGLVAIGRRHPPFDRVIVECSGVSNPVGVLGVFDLPVVANEFHVDGVFCLIDCDTFEGLDYRSTELAIDQAAYSDLVLLNKADIASTDAVSQVVRTLRGAQPHMRMFPTTYADVARGVLFGPSGGRGRELCLPSAADDDHVLLYRSMAFTWAHPLVLADFERLVDALPSGVIRAKGILCVADPTTRSLRKCIFHLVGKRSSLMFEDGPAEAHSKAVFIGLSEKLNSDDVRNATSHCPGGQDVTAPHPPHRHDHV